MNTKRIIINHLVLCTALILLASAPISKAAAGKDTWTGGAGTANWADGSNWTGANTPPTTGDTPTFGTVGAGGATLNNNLIALTSFLGLTFNSGAPSFLLNGNSIDSTGGIADNSPNLETINLNLQFTSSHSVNAIAGGTLLIGGVVSGAGGINKGGAGTVTLTNANIYTGTTAVNAGTLKLDFSAAGAPAANIVKNTSAISLGGGTLLVNGSSLVANSQAFASTTFAGAEGSVINAAAVSGANFPTVTLAALTYAAGGTVEFIGPAYNNAITTAAGQAAGGNQAATATITTTAGAANVFLNSSSTGVSPGTGTAAQAGFATVNLYDFAYLTGSTPFSIVGASQGTGGTAGDGAYTLVNNASAPATSGNLDLMGATDNSNSSTSNFGLIRCNAPGATTFNVRSVTSCQGFMVTPNVAANNITISGSSSFAPGLRSSANAGSIVFWQNNLLGFLNISMALSDDGNKAGGAFVQAGPGTVAYNNANTYTGQTYLDGGYSLINGTSGNAAFGALATGANLNLNGGTVVANASVALDNAGSTPKRALVLGSNGGGLAATTGNTLTVDGVISGANALTIGAGTIPGTGGTTANLTALTGDGTVILSGVDTYSGNTIVNIGTLALAATGTINSTPQIYTATNATFDGSAVTGFTLGGGQSLAGYGTNNGSVNTSSGSIIYAGTDGGYGTNTFNNNLTNVSGAVISMDVGTLYNGSNDFIFVGGTLALNSTTFHLKAPSTAVNLDTTADYVLMTAASISGTPNSTPVWDVQPANAANFIVTLSGNSVVLHFSASAPPSGSGSASPASVNRNQNTLITVIATPGSSPIGSVVLNTSLIGGSSVMLVQSNLSNVYTNTVTVSAGNATGIFALPATIADTSSPTPLSSVINVSLTVVNTQTWDGLGADSNWSTGGNWVSAVAPVAGDFVTFSGSTRTSPAMDANNNLTGMAFASGAASFTLGSLSSYLTLTANGITNNSANLQTVNLPITLTAAQTINAAAGNLAVSQAITNGGNLLAFDGNSNSIVRGVITGAGGLAKNGAGKLTLSGANSYTGTTAGNAGTLEVTNNGVINGGALSGAGFVVDGGSVTASGTSTFSALNNAFLESAGSVSANAFNANANDATLLQITGGSFSAASVTLPRTQSYATAPAATAPIAGVTTSGLYINGAGATVSLGTLSIGTGNSSASVRVDAGTVTASGEVLVSRISGGSTRWSILQVNGGSFTSSDPVNGIVISQNNGAATCDGEVYLSGGTTTAELIAFGVATDTLGGQGFVIINNGASLYLGSGGIVKPNATGSYTSTVSLLNGSLGAKADWASSLPMQLSGSSFTIKAADAANGAHNIALSGVLSGGGALTKTGNGSLTLSAVETYSGATTINGGTLALTIDGVTSAVGSISSSSIAVGAGATFDVSGLNSLGGFVLGSGKTISGVGTVAGLFEAADNSSISPAGTGAEGTLSFSSGLYATNASFKMELTSDPTGLSTANDAVNITGDFTVGGSNTIVVVPIGSLGLGTYKLIKYSGNFYGDISNLNCVAGTLSASTPGEIDLLVTSVRPVANLFWRGDGLANVWDTGVSSNWLNGVSYDRFYTGDTNTFDDSATNFVVNLSGILTPAPAFVVLVNATNDYTFATGGDISGSTGLTKTNTGNLTIADSHDYTGVTTISGGTLSAAILSVGGTASSIGAAGASPTNLVLNGGTLAYLGANKTIDRGAMLQSGNGTLSVAQSSTTLTISGTLTGPGSLTKTGNGQITLTGANNYVGGTVITDGTIRANPASGIGTNTLTLNGTTSPATFQFSGDSQVLSDILNVVGNNNFIANGGNDTVGGVTGNGTVYLNGSGSQLLTLQAIDTSSFTGTFFINTLPTIRFFPTSGTTLNASNATFNLGSASGQLINRDGGNYSLGALAGGSSTKLLGSANSGSAVTTYTIGGNNTDSDFSGVIATGTGGTGAKVNIVKVGNGRLTLSGVNTYNGNTTISYGTLALGDGSTDGSISSSPTIDVATGAVLDVSARSDQTLTLGGTQTLRGNGIINGNVTANSSSTLSPADTDGVIGLLTITNALTLSGNSTNKLDLDATAHTNDVIVVQGPAGIAFAGTLNLNVAAGTLAAGQTFKLFTAPSYGGAFATILPATPGAGLAWNTNNLTVNGSISVAATTPPSIGGITISGSDIVFSSTNGTPGGQVIVLTSTNVALPVIQWTALVTNNYDSSGSFTYTNSGALSSGQTQQFYLLQTQ